MTDYDATIARLKIDALRQLRMHTNLPHSIPAPDAREAYDKALNAIMAPALSRLMSTMLALDSANSGFKTMADQLEAERHAVRRRDGWVHEKDAEIRKRDTKILELAGEQALLIKQVNELKSHLETRDAQILELEGARVVPDWNANV